VRLRALAAVALLALAGCAAKAPVVPPADMPLRNPTAPLGGTSRFAADRFAGPWETVACIGRCDRQVSYAAAGPLYLRQSASGQRAYRLGAPGILRSESGDGTLVVMWVDEGFRTAAVGDAAGTWAAILDRNRVPAPDRFAAAAEILDFNGWDISRLERIN